VHFGASGGSDCVLIRQQSLAVSLHEHARLGKHGRQGVEETLSLRNTVGDVVVEAIEQTQKFSADNGEISGHGQANAKLRLTFSQKSCCSFALILSVPLVARDEGKQDADREQQHSKLCHRLGVGLEPLLCKAEMTNNFIQRLGDTWQADACVQSPLYMHQPNLEFV